MEIRAWESGSSTEIRLRIRDVTNSGSWQTLQTTTLPYLLSGDVDVYLGTDRVTDYSSSGSMETYYYDNYYVYPSAADPQMP
jgi:hypothetical protein